MVHTVRLFRLAALAVVASGFVYLGGCSSSDERAQSHYDRGTELVAQGELAKASLEFRNALKLNSEHVDALFALGDVQERQGNYDSVLGLYLAATERDPEHLEARIRLAHILMTAGQLDAASKYADQAVAIAGNDAAAMVAKAAIELKLDNRGEAVRLAQAALENAPEMAEALMILASERLVASDPAGALTFLEVTNEENERNVGLQILRLSALDALDDQPAVEQVFKRLLELFPDNPAFREGLVRWYLSKGRNEQAEQVLRQYAAANSTDDQAWLNLVAYLNETKGPDAAAAELSAIISKRSMEEAESFPFRMALAQLQFTTGRQKEAMDLTRSIIAQAEDHKDRNLARIQLAKMTASTASTASTESTESTASTEKMAAAEDIANIVLENDSKNVDALSVRASIRLRNGNISGAIEDLVAALNEAPDDARLHVLLAESYERAGSVVLAEEHYAKAQTLERSSPEIGLQMTRFLLRYGKTGQARRLLESIRGYAPTDRRVLTMLAQLRLATRDWTGAQEIAHTLREIEESSEAVAADRITAAALSGLNRHTDSIRLLQSWASNASDRQTILPDLVGAYVRAGRQQAAEDYLMSILESDPANVQAHVLLGSVYMTTDRVDLAESAFATAAANDSGVIGITSQAQFYLTTGRYEEAEDAARSGLERDHQNTALRLLQAAIFERTERFEDAIKVHEALFKSDPESTVVANDLASLLSERRGGEEALNRAYEIAQRFRSSEIPQYQDTLGWIYYLRGDYTSALPVLKTAAEKLPGIALVQYHLGMALAALDQDELAASNLEKAISLSPPLIDSDLQKAKTALANLRVDTSDSATTTQ